MLGGSTMLGMIATISIIATLVVCIVWSINEGVRQADYKADSEEIID